jgi:hypothetical protein
MSEESLHRLVIETRIGIVSENIGAPDFETMDGETVVMVSIGMGETHVTVLSDEARLRSRWTAAFGWSALTRIPVGPDGSRPDPEELPRALKGQLKRYGTLLGTEGFLSEAQSLLRVAISHILDRTIGSGSVYDRIVIAAPAWLHEAVSGCMDLRPHIWNEIQDL